MKVKFGAIVTDGRGKLGGHVFSKNRSGNYMRTKVTPVNPQTTFQQNQRSALATLSSGWSGLTNAERDAWNAAVGDFQKTDIFGDLKSPTGKNLYTGLNRNLLNAAQAIITVPPIPASIAGINITAATYAIGLGTFDIITTGGAVGTFVQVWATPPMSLGTTFIKNQLRLLESVAGAVDATIDPFASYNTRFGAPPIGANVHVALKVVNAGGEAGVPVSKKATVVA